MPTRLLKPRRVSRTFRLTSDLGAHDRVVAEVLDSLRTDRMNVFHPDGRGAFASASGGEHVDLLAGATLEVGIREWLGWVMDGQTRLKRALLDGAASIRAVRFPVTPDPDYTDGIDSLTDS